MGFSKEWSFYC